MKKPVNKLTISLLMSTFLLIVIPSDKWNILMFQAMILGLFALYDVSAFLFVFSEYAGMILLFLALLSYDQCGKSLKYAKNGAIILLLRLIAGHIVNHQWIWYYDHAYYVMPELIFVTLSVYTLLQPLKREVSLL